MKKNYITPMAGVIDVDTESLICGSPLSLDKDPADDSEVLGKGRDFYEEDEEELW